MGRYIILSSCLLLVILSLGSTHWVANINNTGTGTLRAAVDSAQNGDTIRFQASLISSGNNTITLSSQISITKSLYIIGIFNSSDSLFISGNSTTRIFDVQSCDSLFMDSLLFISGRTTTSNGGAISIQDSLSVIVFRNCFFKENRAKYKGGAIYINNRPDTTLNSIIQIENTTFYRNKSDEDAGAVYIKANSDSLLFKNSSFEKNIASDIGGAAYLDIETRNLTLLENTFSKNEAYDTAGGIYLIIKASTFWIDSTAFLSNYGTGAGGGIRLLGEVDTMTISRSTFSQNIAKKGGGLIVEASTKYIDIDNSSFLSNIAQDDGGGFYLHSNCDFLNFTNSTFNGNYAADSAGGAFIVIDAKKFTVLNCSIQANTTNGNGGGIKLIATLDTLIIENTLIKDNEANNGGGFDMKVTSDYVSFTNLDIHGNDILRSGGGIYADLNATNLNLTNFDITENTTDYYGGNGSGILISGDITNMINLTDFKLYKNLTETSGVVGLQANAKKLHVKNINSFNNRCNNGLANSMFIMNEIDSVFIDSCNFKKDSSAYSSNSFYIDLAAKYMNIKNLSFVSNLGQGLDVNQYGGFLDLKNIRSDSNGGGGITVLAYTDSFLIRNISTKHNTNYYTAGISISAKGKKGLVRNVISYNNKSTSHIGGGIKISGKNLDSLIVQNMDIQNCYADDEGGGLYAYFDSSSVVFDNLAVENNESYSGMGGGAYIDSKYGDLSINNSKFNKNKADEYGGGLYVNIYKSSVLIDHCEINDNYAYESGGGGYISGTLDSLTIQNTDFKNNKSDYLGGGLYTVLQTPIINFSHLNFDNNVGDYGGGAYLGSYSNDDSSTLKMSHCHFSKNTNNGFTMYMTYDSLYLEHSDFSENSGGALHFGSTRGCVITGSTFNNNKSDYGAAIKAINPTIINSTFSRDTASVEGGSIYFYDNLYLKNVTINESSADSGSAVFGKKSKKSYTKLTTISSILATYDSSVVYTDSIHSLGYNIFSNTNAGVISTDQTYVSKSNLNLGALQYNGGYTKTLPPLPGSVAIDKGNPADSSTAQNGPILYQRDAGAAESCMFKTRRDTIVAFCNYTWIDNVTYTRDTVVFDSLGVAANGCDSVAFLNLTIKDIDTFAITYPGCDSLYFDNTWHFSSALLVDTLSSVNNCDSITHIYISISPSKTAKDSIVSCDSALVNGNWYSSTRSIIDTLYTKSGCDSIVTTNLTINNSK